MSKKLHNIFRKIVLGVGWGTTCLLTTTPLISCANKRAPISNPVSLVSTSSDYFLQQNQHIIFTFKFGGNKTPTQIFKVTVIESHCLELSSDTHNIPVAQDGTFIMNIMLKELPSQTDEQPWIFLRLQYNIGDEEHFALLDKKTATLPYDHCAFTCLLQHPECSTNIDDKISYTIGIKDCFCFPSKINKIQILTHQDKIGLVGDPKPDVDPATKTFSFDVKSAVDIAECGNIPFDIKFIYDIDDFQNLESTTSLNFTYYQLNIRQTGQSQEYIFKNGTFDVFYSISSATTIEQIDKVNIETITPCEDGKIYLDKSTDIKVVDNEFKLTFVYDNKLGFGEKLEHPQFKVFFDITPSSEYPIKNFTPSDNSITITTFKLGYKGTKVKITALQPGKIGIKNHSMDSASIDRYNILYKTDSMDEAQKYELPKQSDQVGDWIDLTQTPSVEFCCNSGVWSNYTGSHDSFSGPRFVCQNDVPIILEGDVTSLIDGEGGKIKDLNKVRNDNDYIGFAQTFTGTLSSETTTILGTNVVCVSDNFLPATTLDHDAYESMFCHNINLIDAPDLPATELAPYCYQKMFLECSSLMQGPKELPAKQLAEFCCQDMFKGCEHLTNSPIICAEPPPEGSEEEINWSLSGMFRDCSQLAEISLPNWSGLLGSPGSPYEFAYVFRDWVSGVSAKGTFYYPGDEKTHDDSCIPNGWEVVEPLN